MKYYVYIWRDPKNDTPRYVGKGSEHRPYDHIRPNAKSSLALLLKQRRDEGFNLEPEIALMTDDEDKAFALEIELIRKYGREDLHLGTLYNLTDGGPGQSNLSIDRKFKLVEKLKNTLAKPEVKKLRSDASKEVCSRPEVIAKRVATAKVNGLTEEGKAMARARTLASWATRKERAKNG